MLPTLALGVAGCFGVSTDGDGGTPPFLDPTTTGVENTTGSGGPDTDSATGPATTGLDSSTGDPTDADTDTGFVTGDTGHTSTGTTPATTIFDVQDGTILEGEEVEIFEVVVTATEAGGFFVQEPEGGMYSGIWVSIEFPAPVTRGVEVNITGTVVEVDGMTTIAAAAGGVVATGVMDVEPAPTLVTSAALTPAMAEPWEGVLVRVEGAPLDITALPPGGFTLADGATSFEAGYRFYDPTTEPMVFPGFGVGASLTAANGVMSENLEGYRMLPRDSDDLEGFDPSLLPDEHDFPIAADTRVITSGTLPWNVGDYFEGLRASTAGSITGVDVHIDVISNGLTACGFQNANVLINGTVVGDFTIAQGTTAIDESFAIAPAIIGPNYTVRYQTTATVASGCGAAGYNEMTSTIGFVP